MGIAAKWDPTFPAALLLAFFRLPVLACEQPRDRRFPRAFIGSTADFKGSERSFCSLDQLSIPQIEPPKGKRENRQQRAGHLSQTGELEVPAQRRDRSCRQCSRYDQIEPHCRQALLGVQSEVIPCLLA